MRLISRSENDSSKNLPSHKSSKPSTSAIKTNHFELLNNKLQFFQVREWVQQRLKLKQLGKFKTMIISHVLIRCWLYLTHFTYVFIIHYSFHLIYPRYAQIFPQTVIFFYSFEFALFLAIVSLNYRSRKFQINLRRWGKIDDEFFSTI